MMDDIERFERLLVLLLLEAIKGAPQKEKVWKLNMAGFSNIEIAELLNTTPAVIANYLYGYKKGRKKKLGLRTKTKRTKR